MGAYVSYYKITVSRSSNFDETRTLNEQGEEIVQTDVVIPEKTISGKLTSYTATGLRPSCSYYFRLSACNKSGCSTTIMGPISTASLSNTLLEFELLLDVVLVTVKWKTQEGVTYFLEYKEGLDTASTGDSEGYLSLVKDEEYYPNMGLYEHTGLMPNRTYTYRLMGTYRSCDGTRIETPWSYSSIVTSYLTLAVGSISLLAQAALEDAIGQNRLFVRLTWEWTQQGLFAFFQKYELRYKKVEDADWAYIADESLSQITTNTYVVEGLEADTNYVFALRCVLPSMYYEQTDTNRLSAPWQSEWVEAFAHTLACPILHDLSPSMMALSYTDLKLSSSDREWTMSLEWERQEGVQYYLRDHELEPGQSGQSLLFDSILVKYDESKIPTLLSKWSFWPSQNAYLGGPGITGTGFVRYQDGKNMAVGIGPCNLCGLPDFVFISDPRYRLGYILDPISGYTPPSYISPPLSFFGYVLDEGKSDDGTYVTEVKYISSMSLQRKDGYISLSVELEEEDVPTSLVLCLSLCPTENSYAYHIVAWKVEFELIVRIPDFVTLTGAMYVALVGTQTGSDAAVLLDMVEYPLQSINSSDGEFTALVPLSGSEAYTGYELRFLISDTLQEPTLSSFPRHSTEVTPLMAFHGFTVRRRFPYWLSMSLNPDGELAVDLYDSKDSDAESTWHGTGSASITSLNQFLIGGFTNVKLTRSDNGSYQHFPEVAYLSTNHLLTLDEYNNCLFGNSDCRCTDWESGKVTWSGTSAVLKFEEAVSLISDTFFFDLKDVEAIDTTTNGPMSFPWTWEKVPCYSVHDSNKCLANISLLIKDVDLISKDPAVEMLTAPTIVESED